MSYVLEGFTMFIKDLEETIAKCDAATLHRLTTSFWADYANGKYSDDQANQFSRLLESRKSRFKPHPLPLYPKPKKPVLRSPERILRRRRCAASGAMPHELSQHFTQGQLAAISIILAHIRKNGVCQIFVSQIAAMAGVCVRVVQQALQIAQRLGLLNVQQRRRANRPNLTNLITILSNKLAKWVGRFKAVGESLCVLTNTNNNQPVMKKTYGSQTANIHLGFR
jgi:hypothetical protein